jgi:hypothetical protein
MIYLTLHNIYNRQSEVRSICLFCFAFICGP